MTLSRNNPTWLNTAAFYEVYPQSFYDSNADGIGDLPGVIERLDYIQSLGCNALWLNPCFESPFGDAGYDISNFYKVAPRYGTNEDLYKLFRRAKKRGMRVVLDLVAGHTSGLQASGNPRQRPFNKSMATASATAIMSLMSSIFGPR